MRSATLAILVLLAAPVAAGAATVDAVSGTVTVLAFDAAPGEQNRLQIHLQGGTAVITDSGAPLNPGIGCERASTGTVRCSWEGVVVLSVSLGDGDDAATADASDNSLLIESSFDGGPGDDHIRGTDRDDALGGGGGRDVLEGGDGADTLLDGDRRGRRGIDADVIDGGPGTDSVSYRGRAGALRVRLGSTGGNGERGEGDRLRSVEGVVGGRGPDLLVGDHRRNRIEGGDGHDRLLGNSGPDRLNGGRGRDRLDGGRGEDRLESEERDDSGGFPPPETDSVRCGDDEDLVASTDPLGILAADCERVGDLPVVPSLDVARGRALYRDLPCRALNGRTRRCEAVMQLRDRRNRLVARGRGAATATSPQDGGEAPFSVRMRLTRHGRRVLTQRRPAILRTRMVRIERESGTPETRSTFRFTFVLP